MSEKTEVAFKGLACPCCGDDEEGFWLDLITLKDCKCESCGDVFEISVAVRKFEERLAAWKKVERLAEYGHKLASE